MRRSDHLDAMHPDRPEGQPEPEHTPPRATPIETPPERQLRKQVELLETTLENIEQGVSMVDAELRVVVFNRRFLELLEFPTDRFRPGTPLEELIRYNAERGEYGPGDVEELVRERMALARRFEPHCIERIRPDGTIIEIRGKPLPNGGLVTTYTDITARKRAELELRRAHKQLTFHVENSPLTVIEWDHEFRIQRWSQQAENTFGWSAYEVLGKRPDEWPFVFEEDVDKVNEAIVELKSGRVRRKVCRNRNYTKDGDVRLCEWYNSVLLDESDSPVSVLSLVQDITESHQLSKRLSYHATHDPLTGFVNRREFERRLHRALSSACAEHTSHTLCYLDLDRFKLLNDSCGHIAGDALLRQLGQLLPGKIRQQDTLGRLGGDEFGILMENCSVEEAYETARILRDTIEELRFTWKGQKFSIGVSIGITAITSTIDGITDVMTAADAACYLAKEHGRNRIHIYSEGDSELERRQSETQWVNRIEQALDGDRFKLYYQPIIPVEGESKGEHYELLLRMQDEEGRLISPGAFLPAAERYHVSNKLDCWVIQHAFEWLAARPEHVERLFLCSINLSGHSLGDEEFLDYVTSTLDQVTLPPDKICFEITETAAVADLSTASRFMRVLKEWGCCFALDDFGTGLSSFGYLKTLPVDFLKIDGVFIKNIADNPFDLAMVKSINEIGQAMGKKTIAEFVENEAILERLKLKHIGVDYAQGYHIARPRPLDEMES